MAQTDDFMTAVLGPSGAAALDSLAKASDDLAAFLLPRTAVAWLQGLPAGELYDGLPGVTTRFLLAKTADTIPVFSGVAAVGGTEYAFDDAPVEHVAAVIAVALGADPGSPDLREVDVARLGKTVDLLVKARKKGGAEGGTGLVAGPIAPEPPAAPTPTAPTAPKPQAAKTLKPKAVKPPKPAAKMAAGTLKLSEAEARHPCDTCQAPQFWGSAFMGCFCLRGLAKSSSVTKVAGGYDLNLGEDWDDDAVLTLLEAVGR
jgi:hypothetical protein